MNILESQLCPSRKRRYIRVLPQSRLLRLKVLLRL